MLGVAVMSTVWPVGAVQTLPGHAVPLSVAETLPWAPAVAVIVWFVGAKVAVSVSSAVELTVTGQVRLVPRVLHDGPLQLVTAYPAAGVAVSVTVVPA